jgi:hypothetical protein
MKFNYIPIPNNTKQTGHKIISLFLSLETPLT